MPEPVFMIVGMYIMAPESISNFTLSCFPLNVFVFYEDRVASKEIRRLVLSKTSCFILK
jgi:hypothetical protein